MANSIETTRILIVDDEALVAMDLEGRLKQLGYTICGRASTAEKALELVEQHQPDLVMMDIVLKGEMDGIDAAEVIRDKWGIPVVFLTSYADTDRLERAKLTYPFGYLLKPFQDRDLKITVEMALYVAQVNAERLNAEKALRRETAWRKMLVNGSRDGIVVLDQAGKVYETNQKFADLLGYDSEEVLDLHVWDWDAQWDREQLIEMLENVDEEGDHFETQHRRKDGAIINVEISTNGAFQEDEKLVFCICRDITERKQAEQSLRQSEERYRTILQISMDGFCLVDSSGRLIQVNDSYCNMTGYTEPELLSMKLNDLEAVETLGTTASHMQKVISEGKDRFETKHRRRDGSLFDVEVSVQYSSVHGGLFAAFLRDITENKRQRENLQFQSMVLDQIQDHVTVTDLNGVILYVNQAVANSLDRPQNELIGQSTIAYGEDPMQGATQKEIVETTIRDGSWHGEVVNYSADGSEIIFECRTQVIHDQQGNPASLCGIAAEITERKRAEERLRKSEERYRLIANNTSDSIWAMDSDFQFTYLSPSTERLFGYTLAEWQTLDWGEFVHPAYLDEVRHLFTGIQQRETENVAAVIKVRRKDKVELWVEYRATAIWGPDSQLSSIVGVTRDITDRKKAEEALEASEAAVRNKLQAILEPGSDLGVLALEDIIDVPAVQSLMENFYQITGIGSAIVDNNGKVLVGVGWQDICTKFHRCHPETLKNCIESDTVLAKGAEPGQFKAYLCKNGMWDMASPIEVSGQHMGNIYLGQFTYSDEEPDAEWFRDQAKRYGFDEAEYLDALSQVPRYGRNTVEEVMGFYSKLGEMISSLSFSNVSLSRTLTESKRKEEALRASEEKYRILADNASDVIFTLDMDLNYTYVSPSVLKMRGFLPEEVLSGNISQSLTKTSMERAARLLSEELELEQQANTGSERVRVIELEMQCKDGTTIWTEAKVSFLRDNDRNPIGIIGASRDISDRKKAEGVLKESEARFRAIFEKSPYPKAITEATSGRIIEVNEIFCQKTGLGKKDLIGKTTTEMEFYSPEERTKFVDLLLSHGKVDGLEMRFKTPKQEYVTKMYADFITLGNDKYVLTTFDDITESRKAEEALKDSEQKWRNILIDTPQIGITLDPQANIIFANKRFLELTGWDEKEVINQNWFDLFIPEELREEVRNVFRNVMQSRATRGFSSYENEITTKTGDRLNISWANVLTRDVGGNVIDVTCLGIDLTERKKSEEALRESEERFRGIFKTSPIGIAIVDTATQKFLQANESFLEIVGYSMEELQELKVKNITVPDDWKIEKDLISDYLSANLSTYDFVKRYKRKNGEIKYVHISGDVLNRHDGEPPLAVANVIDITDRLKAEKEKDQLQAQLQQAQKMEAIGTLAGGVAHDFNNLLQAINGYTQLLLMEKSEKDSEYASLMAIQNSGMRASELVRSLLLFSRKAETERKPLELNIEVEHARSILERTIPKMVDISFYPGSRLWRVMADPVQIEQILLNLGTNAADAMPDGGKLILETENITIDAEYAKKHLNAQPCRYVLLTISDTGHGMDRETQVKIFDPFFTTKEIGKGTGLGLASVYGIVQSHGGYIRCYSEVGIGTTFKIYFPAMVQPEIQETEDVKPKPVPKGTETILLVDDEEAIRGFAQQVLMKFGYKVMTASTGEEALEVYQSHSGTIDLVITDIGMPGMGGHRCVEELLKINSATKIIIASGYPINGQVKRSMDTGAAGYIGKPYKLSDLLNTVRAVLDEGK